MTPEKLNQLHEIKRQFLERFPLESLHTMPLAVYTNLERSGSFCYWLESITYDLGSIWGGSAYKFYIFEYNQSRNTEKKNGKYLRDGKCRGRARGTTCSAQMGTGRGGQMGTARSAQ